MSCLTVQHTRAILTAEEPRLGRPRSLQDRYGFGYALGPLTSIRPPWFHPTRPKNPQVGTEASTARVTMRLISSWVPRLRRSFALRLPSTRTESARWREPAGRPRAKSAMGSLSRSRHRFDRSTRPRRASPDPCSRGGSLVRPNPQRDRDHRAQSLRLSSRDRARPRVSKTATQANHALHRRVQRLRLG